VRCPSCRDEIDIEIWQAWMEHDWSEAAGFRLERIVVSCCNRAFTLADFKYEEPQGFSRFALCARNPEKILNNRALAEVEAVLGCKLRVIHQRI